MTQLLDIAARWREEGDHLRTRYNDEPKARLCEVHAEELERALFEAGNESLTLKEAANQTGYSVDHLGRMVREGKIPNTGRKGAPRVLARDLFWKLGLPHAMPRPQLVGSSRSQIARSVLSQMGGEG